MSPGQDILLTWADLALLAVVLVSVGVGAWRGLVFEALSLAAWVVAYIAAPWLAPVVAGWLPERSAEAGWQSLAAIVLAFLLVLVLCGLVARLVRVLLHATPLQGIDRLLGAGFGLLRGGLLCLLAAVLVGLTPFKEHPVWKDSLLRPWLAATLHGLAPLLPNDLHRLVAPTAPAESPTT